MAKRAKKAKPFIPETLIDEEGFETDGMFRWGGPKIPLTAENMQKYVDDFNTDLRETAQERIAALRRHVSQFIYFFVDGPFTLEKARTFGGRTIMRLDVAMGDGFYVLKQGLPTK